MGEGNKTLSGTDTGSLFGEVSWQGSSIDFYRFNPCSFVFIRG